MSHVQIPNRLARVVAHTGRLPEKRLVFLGAGEAIGSRYHRFVPRLSQLPRPYQSPRPFRKGLHDLEIAATEWTTEKP